MEARQEQGSAVQAPTRALAAFAATLRYDDLPAPVLAVAKHCILDWLGVTLAGSHDPLVGMLIDEVDDQGGNAQASIIGWNRRASMSQAALVNGAAGHALDFDDVLRAFMGHPTAPVLPALLALAERRGASGRDVIEAFAAGVELEARVGRMMTESHYARGFHSTATLGTIGAATACGRLLGFDADRMATAIGIDLFYTTTDIHRPGARDANGLSHIGSIQPAGENQRLTQLRRNALPIKRFASATGHAGNMAVEQQTAGIRILLRRSHHIQIIGHAQCLHVRPTKTQAEYFGFIAMKLENIQWHPLQHFTNLLVGRIHKQTYRGDEGRRCRANRRGLLYPDKAGTGWIKHQTNSIRAQPRR